MEEYLNKLNESQREAVEYNEGPSLVIAGAGSGKTRVLTYKIAYLVHLGLAPQSILALTFTNKAAREMKERIAAITGDQTARRLWMGTFHSIFSRILRYEAEHIGYPSNFTIYDTTDSKSLLKAIIKEMQLDDKVYRLGMVQSRISNAKNALVTWKAYEQSKELMQHDIDSKVPLLREIYKRYQNRCQQAGAMEGKETRLGPAATALWSCTTTVTSNGSVNGMHDSTMPLSGMMEMLNMQINTWFGGVGVGFMNYYAFLIIAVFISGLMVGRTPEFLGKKVEAREMKIATIVALAHPFVILIGTAVACYYWVYNPAFVEAEGGWLNNPGFHGLSEMLYEYTSSSANNGSGFEGLGDNTYFWNFTTGLALIISRYLPIVGQVAIAGLLAQKKYIPESAGTLKTDTATFAVMTFSVIFIIAALSFFPALTLGPIAEYFSIY